MPVQTFRPIDVNPAAFGGASGFPGAPPLQIPPRSSYPGGVRPATKLADYARSFSDFQTQALQGYQQNLARFAGPLRDQLFQAMPELKQASDFLQERFKNPISESAQNTYRQNFQQLITQRGFDPGSQGPATQGAEYLTSLVENQRMQLLPQLASFGQTVQGLSGLQPPQLDFGTYTSQLLRQQELNLNQAQFEESVRSGREQSQFTRDIYNQYRSDLEESKRLAKSPLDEVERSREYYQAEALKRIIPQQYPGLSGPYNAYATPSGAPWQPDEGLPTGSQAPMFWGDYVGSWVANLRGRGLL